MDEPAETRQETVGDFPKELIDFLQGAPRLLVIKGKTRTGKTLFALGLAETVASPQNTFIISTRAYEPQAYEAFPWLRYNEDRDKSLEILARVSAHPKPKAPEPPATPLQAARIKSAREMLRGILGEVPDVPAPEDEKQGPPHESLDETDLPALRGAIGDKNPKELARIYRGLARVPAGTGGVFVLLDRADRLCERLGIDLPRLAQALGADIARKHKAHLVLVLDKPTADLDPPADGVISLKEAGHGDDFLGQLEMTKLGNLKLKNPRWMYNLNGGRFQVLKGMRVWG
jgi:hypothetical protein